MNNLISTKEYLSLVLVEYMIELYVNISSRDIIVHAGNKNSLRNT